MNYHAIAGTYQIGDKVWVPLAVGRACGTVVEDRGGHGVGGEHLYRVSVPSDPFEPSEFLVGENQIEHLTPAEREGLNSRLPTDKVRDFFMHGGLITILQRNSPERIWLRFDPLGHVTYTFIEGYSNTGGTVAPRLALHGEKIFTPVQAEVIEFMEKFGLSASDAAQVVRAVGTAP